MFKTDKFAQPRLCPTRDDQLISVGGSAAHVSDLTRLPFSLFISQVVVLKLLFNSRSVQRTRTDAGQTDGLASDPSTEVKKIRRREGKQGRQMDTH